MKLGRRRSVAARSGARALAYLWLTPVALACSDRVTWSTPEPPVVATDYRKVTLDPMPGEPISLALLPDASVLYATRRGQLWWRTPEGERLEAARFDVYSHDEEGLQGLALDPDFEQNHWVYLYYSPPLGTPVDDPSTPDLDEGAAPESGVAADWAPFAGLLRLSRFRFEAPRLDRSSEQVLLEVPVERGLCCHVGGQIDFDGAGNLYLSTGDDTNPFQSQGYAPLDSSPGRNPAFDARRSAGNTNDLRGKLLRVRVEPDGSLSIPEGNLFPSGTAGTRPEIYLMGLRNPFRFAVDRENGEIYLADYSPDAREPNPLRGPPGTGRWMLVREPANYGWPYCATPTLPYVEYDFASGASGAPFDCARLRNESPYNTGLVELPPTQAPELSYSFGGQTSWPELGAGGVGPMAGPAYVYDPARSSQIAWPAELGGAAVFYEWTRDFVSVFHLDGARSLSSIERLTLDVPVDNPIDVDFGPDGALYVLEYGDGYFTANPEAQLSRIEYRGPSE